MESTVLTSLCVAALLFAVGTVAASSVVHAAVCLLACLALLAPVYVILAGAFIATVHLLVYVGAIMVLFMVAVMLLEGAPKGAAPPSPPHRVLGLALPLLALALLVSAALPLPALRPALPGGFGTAGAIGELLLTRHAFAFEAVSLLLVAAMAAVVAFSRKEEKA